MIEHPVNDNSFTHPVHNPKDYVGHPLNREYLNLDMKSELFTIIARKEAFKILQTSSLKTIKKYLKAN